MDKKLQTEIEVKDINSQINSRVDSQVDPQANPQASSLELMQAGAHFGHRASATHPKMKPYLFGARNTVSIIDLEKTVQKIGEALTFISKTVKDGKTILFVGTKIQIKNLVKSFLEECQMPFVAERWLGGTFTNFEVIKKRVDYLKTLEKQKAEGNLEKYTKKERLKIEKEIKDLNFRLGGIKEMEKLPEVIFVCDIKKDFSAVKEARQKGITVIGIVDTNVDPNLTDYPIPANDDAISSVKYILDKVKETILATKAA